MDSIAAPQPLMTSCILIMAIGGDFLSSLNTKSWDSNSCSHRFPFLHTYQHVWKIAPLSLCCCLWAVTVYAVPFRPCDLLCRTSEVISWVIKVHWWESPGAGSVLCEMLMITRQERFSDNLNCFHWSWRMGTLVSGHLLHMEKLWLNWVSDRWPWMF